jgi:hypothetical protein
MWTHRRRATVDVMRSPSRRGARLRELANWVNGSTLLGLFLARAAGARPVRAADGIWNASGVRLPTAGRTFTVGNVVLHRHGPEHLCNRPELLAHERAHATQWAWAGPAFLPLYLVECLVSWAVTGDTANGNAFEVGAGLRRGGYPTPALRRRARPRAR